jgi:hypothetical protein
LQGAKLKDLVADGLRLALARVATRNVPKRVRFPIIKARPGSPMITKDMVDAAEERMLREEAEHHAKLMRR